MQVATHPGNFHADDVFAVAVLGLAAGPLEIVRTREEAALAAADARVDVGGRDDPATGDYDHHQKGGAGERPNGVRYASFGLVWRHHGPSLAGGAEAAGAIDERLVQGVDANDTGQTISQPLVGDIRPMTVSGVIAAMNPAWDEKLTPAQEDARFAEAVALATRILEGELAGAAAFARAGGLVRAAIDRAADPRVVELERNMPWRDAVVATAPAGALRDLSQGRRLGAPSRAEGCRDLREPQGPAGRVGRPQRRGARRGHRRRGRGVLPPRPLLRVGRQPRGHRVARRAGARGRRLTRRPRSRPTP
jgi:hypothetical protein